MAKDENLISEYAEDEYEDTMHENARKPFLGYGQEGEDEDFLVGTEEGLKNLVDACQIALEKGECVDYALGEFAGIKLVDDSYYQEDNETVGTWFLNKFTVPIIVLLFVCSLVVGFVTIVKWIFSNV